MRHLVPPVPLWTLSPVNPTSLTRTRAGYRPPFTGPCPRSTSTTGVSPWLPARVMGEAVMVAVTGGMHLLAGPWRHSNDMLVGAPS